MNTVLKKAGLGIAAIATTMGMAAAPAQAQRYGYHHYHHRSGGDVAGAAIIGGILGLGVGAAIASSNRPTYYDRGYYNRGYYDGGYYNRGYYAPPPPPAPAYGYNGYGNGYYQQCVEQYRWDPYYGRNVRVQVCN